MDRLLGINLNNNHMLDLVCYECMVPLDKRLNNMICPCCHKEWNINNGIPNFLTKQDCDKYQMAEQSGDIVQIAKVNGWQYAAEIASSRTNDPAYQHEYISSESRADFFMLMPITEKSIVLDVGCGWGNISTAFARKCQHVYSIDISRKNLEFLQIRAMQEKLDNITTIQTDASCLPLPNNSIDIALLVGVLEWVASGKGDINPRYAQIEVLNNLLNKLKPGGCLYIGIENRFSYKYFLGEKEPHTGLRYVNLLPHNLANLYSTKVQGTPFTNITYSLRGIYNLLKQAGYSRINIYFPIPGYQIFRFLTDYKNKGISRFVFSQLRAHPKYSSLHYFTSRIMLSVGLHKWLAPCFSIYAYKKDEL